MNAYPDIFASLRPNRPYPAVVDGGHRPFREAYSYKWLSVLAAAQASTIQTLKLQAIPVKE